MSTTAPQILEKQPAEEISFSMDFTNLLDNGESITGTPTVTVEPANELTVSSITTDGSIVSMFVVGGLHGRNYRFNVLCVTNLGYKREGDGILKVRDR